MAKGIILESSSLSSLILETDKTQVTRHLHVFETRGLSNYFFNFLTQSEKNFSFIGVGIGPGAYTGVRVSITIAKSLAYALNIPIVCFSSLESFVPEKDGKFLSIIDAKIGGVYACKAERSNQEVRFSKPSLFSIQDINLILKDTPRVISPDLEAVKKRIDPNFNIEWTLGMPNEQELARLCFSRFSKKNFVTIDDLKPIYLRDA